MNGEFLIPIFLFGGMAAVVWKFFDGRHRERMSIIEKGLVGEDLKYLYARSASQTNPYSALKYGMLAAYIGGGVLISAFLNTILWQNQEMITTGVIFLSGGLGLISFYSIAKKKMEKELNEGK